MEVELRASLCLVRFQLLDERNHPILAEMMDRKAHTPTAAGMCLRIVSPDFRLFSLPRVPATRGIKTKMGSSVVCNTSF